MITRVLYHCQERRHLITLSCVTNVKRIMQIAAILLLFLLINLSITALDLPEISIFTGLRGAYSTETYVPTWLLGNRYGLYQTERSQIIPETSINYDQRLNDFWGVHGALTLQGAYSENSAVRVPIGYAAVTGGPFILHGGRFPLQVGELPIPSLSSGSLSVSSNAVPLPRIAGRSDGFISVPGLPEVIQTSFGLSHGWFEEDRYTSNALLHEKWLYLQFAQEQVFSIYGGLVHQVTWGGTNERDNTLPVTLENYGRVFLSRTGGDDATVSDQINRAGDARGIWDFGLSVNLLPTIELSGYYQHYFDTVSGFRRWTNGLDGLKGVTLEWDHSLPVVPRQLLFETIRTDYQGGPYHDLGEFGEPNTFLFGRHSYYRNSAYPSGWTYLGRVIGTPQILTTGEGRDLRIASNRIKATHLGLGGNVAQGVDYRFLWTRAAHRDPQGYTDAPLQIDGATWQYDLLLEFLFDSPFGVERLGGSFGMATSFGDLEPLSLGWVVGVTVEIY